MPKKSKPPAFTAARRARFLAYVKSKPDTSIREAAEYAGVRRWQVKAVLGADLNFTSAYEAARGRRPVEKMSQPLEEPPLLTVLLARAHEAEL